jgi:hypothetical protein
LIFSTSRELPSPAACVSPGTNHLAARRGELRRVAQKRASVLEVEDCTILAHRLAIPSAREEHGGNPCRRVMSSTKCSMWGSRGRTERAAFLRVNAITTTASTKREAKLRSVL